MRPARLRLPCLSVTLLFILVGCRMTIPQPAYRKADESSPAFRQAVAEETARQIEQGKSADDAQYQAVRRVRQETVRIAAAQRDDASAVLAKALEKLAQPRGCWAYTMTTTRRGHGKTVVDVIHFDAYQPEARVWTLVTRNGQAPSEAMQAEFRRTQLRNWKRAQSRSEGRRSPPETMRRFLRFSDLSITGPDEAGQAAFLMQRGRGRVPLLGEMPAAHRTYVFDETRQVVLRQTEVFEEPASMLGGALKLQVWESATDYAVIDPAVPPFPVHTKARLHGQLFGRDTGLVEVETVYSDHRRVKCYDDRFSVKLGELNVLDLIPDAGK